MGLVSLSAQVVPAYIAPYANFSNINVPSNNNSTFGVATANVSLQGNSGRLDLGNGWRQPVGGLFFKDDKRFKGQKKTFEQLVSGNSPVGPVSIIGLQENFCDRFRRLYETDEGIAGLPFAAFGPSRKGLQEILDRLRSDPRLEKIILSGRLNISELVKAFFQNHYAAEKSGSNILKSLLTFITSGVMTENEMLGKLQHLLKENDNDPFIPIGSGLAICCEFPIIDSWFIPFPHRAEFELFTNKGILIADVLLPTGEVVRVMNTHLQDVVSVESQEAQDAQADILRLVMEESPYRVILVGDLNLTPDSLNHQIIFGEDIKNCHQLLKEKIFTFLRNNPLARERGIIDSSDRVIDYIGGEFDFDTSEEMARAVMAVIDNPDSDHRIVLARFLMKQNLNVSGIRRRLPRNPHFVQRLVKKVA
ncbi:MAG: hypothetical protein IPJ69_07675 [Deltaproteobacteria bacterium]|nr:MAG: hypothetical protein IPJ69_07675 [Deltaproteobacteria bacterium]